MTFVTGVDSVHTAATVCDYLQDRLGDDTANATEPDATEPDATEPDATEPDATEVIVVAVDENRSRDAADAANVVQVRLGPGAVRIETRVGDPGSEIQDVAAVEGADEVVIAAHRGEPGSGPEIGETARLLLRELDIPVVVVPVPQLPPT